MKLDWIDTEKQLPKVGTEVLCALLSEYVNAPWSWSFYVITYQGNWAGYCTPNKWALIPRPHTPMNEAHRKALRVHKREQARRAEQAALDRKYRD